MDHTNKHTIIYLHLVSVPQTAPPLARSSILLEYNFINTYLALPSVPFLLYVPVSPSLLSLSLPPFIPSRCTLPFPLAAKHPLTPSLGSRVAT